MTSGGSMNTFSVRRHAVTKTFSGDLHHPPTEAWWGLGDSGQRTLAAFSSIVLVATLSSCRDIFSGVMPSVSASGKATGLGLQAWQ